MTFLKLTITNFDSMENSSYLAEHITEEVYFQDGKDKRAIVKLNEYIKKKNINSYKGWNDEWYPKVNIEEIHPL